MPHFIRNASRWQAGMQADVSSPRHDFESLLLLLGTLPGLSDAQGESVYSPFADRHSGQSMDSANGALCVFGKLTEENDGKPLTRENPVDGLRSQ